MDNVHLSLFFLFIYSKQSFSSKPEAEGRKEENKERKRGVIGGNVFVILWSCFPLKRDVT